MGRCRRFAQMDDDDDDTAAEALPKSKPSGGGTGSNPKKQPPQQQPRRRIADDDEENLELEEEDDEKDLDAMWRDEEEERREETQARRRRGRPWKHPAPDSDEEAEPEEGEDEAREEDLEPVPIGDPVNVTVKGKKQKKHYASFEYEGNTFELEDPVLLTPEDRRQKPYVAIIKDITETEGSLNVTGQWFYRPEEADIMDGGSWTARDTRELFYSFHIDDVPAESVMHKCVVHFIPLCKKIPSRKQHPGFVVQKVYDPAKKKLWNLTDKDYEDKKQQEIDLLVKKTVDCIGELPDIELDDIKLQKRTEDVPSDKNDHFSSKQCLFKKSVNPIDVTREPRTTKYGPFAKAETPGTGSDKPKNYAVLVKYKAVTGEQSRDKWLYKLIESIPLVLKESDGVSHADPAAASRISAKDASSDAGLTPAEKTSEPEESRQLQMTDARCQRCQEKKVGISDIIHAGHGDRYQLECTSCGYTWFSSSDVISSLTVDAPSTAANVGTAPWATAKFDVFEKQLVSPCGQPDNPVAFALQKSTTAYMPTQEKQKSSVKPKSEEPSAPAK